MPYTPIDLYQGILAIFAEAYRWPDSQEVRWLAAATFRQKTQDAVSGWPSVVGNRVYCKDGYSFAVLPKKT